MTRKPCGILLLGAALLSVGTLANCSSTPDPAPSDDPQAVLSSTDEQIFVGDSIEMNYDPNVIMKRAEAYFEKESFSEAIVEYKHFLDLHRNHVLAPYAQYKIATSHHNRFKSIDRDPKPIQESLDAYHKLLVEFPNSRYETEAHEKIQSCQEHLAQHDLFVGEFYYNRESYLAAAHRFENVVNNYSNLEAAGDAMYHLAETYQKMGAEEWARDWLVKLVQNHHDHAMYQPGMTFLTKLKNDHPTLDVPDFKDNQASPVQLARVESEQPRVQQSTVGTPSIGTLSLNHHTECALGSWCGASADIGPSQNLDSTSPTTESCRPGQWC